MLRRLQHVNIPIEILRTVAAIADLGSFSKAGERLGISQPAISAQMKRLQILVGGPVFDRVTGGVALNERGKMIMPHLRRLLEANDHILSIGGAAHESAPLRVGLSNFYTEAFLNRYDRTRHGDLVVVCDNSAALLKGLSDGYIDVACLFKPSREVGRLVAEWSEEFVWARSPGFVLSPGAPVPLVGWPGFISDQVAVQALEDKGLAYRFTFSNCDYHSRIEAVAAGLGVIALPMQRVMPPLIRAKEYYLPNLSSVEAGISIRHGLSRSESEPIVTLLKEVTATVRSHAEDGRALQIA